MPANPSSHNNTPSEPVLVKAELIPQTDDRGRQLSDSQKNEKKVVVDFNPETLDITFTNTLQKGRRNQPAQIVNETTAKLSMELVFDTTLEGTDVRLRTNKAAKMMDPTRTTPRRRDARVRKVPSIVVFQWGTLRFEGYIDSFKEKLEYFAPQGIPLRSTVTISLTQQERNFEPQNQDSTATVTGDFELAENTPLQRLPESSNATKAAQSMGNPNAAKQVAQQNGMENMRHPDVDQVMAPTMGKNPPGNFSAPSQLSQITGGSTQALFSGLRNQTQMRGTTRAAVSLEMGVQSAPTLPTGPNVSFGMGGKINQNTQGGIAADVGLQADINLGIQFQE